MRQPDGESRASPISTAYRNRAPADQVYSALRRLEPLHPANSFEYIDH
jgi:hypothetical protein